MTADDFRRIVLGLTDATEGAHMGHPDFRVQNRIFATLQTDLKSGMVTLTPEQQQEFVRIHPETFVPASGAWGRQGSTLVRLVAADEEIVGEAATMAWRNAIEKGPTGKKKTRP